jgi:hypothetical protein
MDQGCLPLGTVTSECTCEMVMKTVLTKVKVWVGPSQGKVLQALGGLRCKDIEDMCRHRRNRIPTT